MLVNCKQGCKEGRVTTDASLKVETNEAECSFCGEVIPISSFSKLAMKHTGDTIKPKKKPYTFKCVTCNKTVPTKLVNDSLVGIGCDGECKFNVNQIFINMMKNVDRADGVGKENTE